MDSNITFLNTEIWLREAEANLALAVSGTSRRNVSVIFDQRDLPILVARALGRRGILHTKSIHPETTILEVLRRATVGGLRLTSIDQEHGLLNESYNPMIETRYSEDSLEIASRVFTWGPWDSQTLIRAFPAHEKKIIKGGSVRIDLWHRDNVVPRGQVSYLPQESYVLISSNLYINGHYRHWEGLKGIREAGVSKNLRRDLSQFMEEVAYSARIFSSYLELVSELAEKFPLLRIVVRPHPTESMDAWETAVESKENVIVSRVGPITPWIKHASAVIHNGCTSAIEASVAGTPVISFVPVERSEKQVSTVVDNLGVKCADVESVLKEVQAIIVPSASGEPLDRPAISQWLDERLLIGDGHTNTQIVLSEWGKLSDPVPFRYVVSRLLLIAFWGWLNHFRRVIRRGGDSLRGNREFSLEKFPSINSDEMRRLKASVGVSGNKQDSPKIFRLYPRGIVVLPRRNRKHASN